MKLHEIARVELTEGSIDPNITLSIQNIIQRGRANNTFEYMAVARLLQFEPTSKEALDALRALPPVEMVKVATKLLTFIRNQDFAALMQPSLANPKQGYTDWLKLYTASEANESLEAEAEHGYIGFYNGKQQEFYAKTKFDAVKKAREYFKAPKSKEHMIHVELAEKDGKPVVHSTSSI